jgi:rhodanese-related sulfurtransferase
MAESIGKKLIDAAQKAVPSMSADDVQKKLQRHEKIVVLDVREPDEWANGHIKEATLLARGRIEGRIEEMVPDKDTLIVTH